MTRDRATGLFALVLGCAIAFFTSRLPGSTMAGDIGPKAFPYISAGILVFCGIGLIINGKNASPAYYTKEQFKRLALIFGTVMAYVVAMHYMGYVIATFVGLLVLCTMFSQGKGIAVWKRVIFAAVVTGVLYVMFVSVFKIPLPGGKLF